jgi:PAS domain S-box-containing protein
MSDATLDGTQATPGLCHFLRTHQEVIVRDWVERVRAVSPAHHLPAPTLIDHLPAILARVASSMECGADDAAELEQMSESHAIDRLGRGFDLDDVVAEYWLLRRCILDAWAREAGDLIRLSELASLDEAVEHAIAQSIEQFATGRERVLRAVDRIADAATGTADIDEFLQQLVRVTMETATAVDTVAVLLREGDLLRLRAATGLDREIERGFALRIGEGFAGKVAAEGRPLALEAAALDPLVKSQVLRELGIKALYGVPLMHDGAVIGVAHMGSMSAREFSDEDRLLFRTMANRATAVIVQAELVERERLAHRELQQGHTRLLETSSLLDTLLARAPVGFAYLDPELRYLRVNPALAEVHGISVESHLGRKLSDVLPSASTQQLEPLLRTALATGEPTVGQLISGETSQLELGPQHLLVNCYPVPGADGAAIGVGAIITDVTEQARAQERQQLLAETSRRLASSLEYEQVLDTIVQLAVPALGASGAVYELAGDKLRRARGAPGGDGTAFVLTLPPDAAEVLHLGVPRVFQPIPPGLVPLVDERAGASALLLVPLRAREEPVGLLVLASAAAPPSTDLVQEFARRAALALDNARLYRNAQRATAIREQVLATVSHDLKNPISVIHMSAQVLARINEAPLARKQLDSIQRSLARVDHLITDLLDMASIQGGSLAISPAPCEVEQLIADAIQFHEPLALEHGIHLGRGAPAADITLRADRQRLQQVFANLIGNAIKFSPTDATITVQAALADDHVLFTVADQGPGIAPDDLGRIFDAYWSGQRHGKKSTGLGLFIAKGIVEAHGGRLWAESEPGHGATFFFTLPVA